MKLKEIIAPTMKELFIQEIEKKIISGQWQEGMRLPSEREMETQMKVSRTIINGGLNILAQKGFVEIKPRQGVFVSNYIKHGNFETLLSIMNYNGGKLDRKTFDSLMNYRLETDKECAYLAALNHDDNDLIEMKVCYRNLQNEQDPYIISNLKLEFEHLIYMATKNTIYPLICNSFLPLNKTFSEKLFTTYGCQDASYLYADLIDAIEKRDGELAKNHMHQIMTKRIQQLENIYYK